MPRQLRAILFDHIYARPKGENTYTEMTEDDWAAMRDFYQANVENTSGIGMRHKMGMSGTPLPQVQFSDKLTTRRSNR